MTDVRNVGKSFLDALHQSIRSGDINQNDKLSIVRGKIILFSMAIQESIQRVVNKEAPLLKNSAEEPFLENVCCNIGSKNTIKYFANREPSIAVHNDAVIELEDELVGVRFLSMAPYLYDPRDTKQKYPPVVGTFTEETIYRAFMRYCRFNSGIPLEEELQDICIDNKSTYLVTNTFEERMEILKGEGKEYTLAQFKKLLLIIERRNTVEMNLEKDILTPKTILEAALHSLEDEEHKVLTYLRGVVYNKGTESQTKLSKYLRLSINEMKEKIKMFVLTHSNISGHKETKSAEHFRSFGYMERKRARYIYVKKRKYRLLCRQLFKTTNILYWKRITNDD